MFVRVALALAAVTFVTGSLVAAVLGAAGGPVFGSLYRMHTYHVQHPFAFLALASVVFGVVGAGWVRAFGRSVGVRRWASAVGAIALTVVVASVPGGVLWVAYDMAAGFVPDGPAFWSQIGWGAATGLQVGWLVALTSVPFNVLGVAYGLFALDRASGTVARRAVADGPAAGGL
ncbi:hypothetical protein [Rubrivirga sp.]|uniref:hypothetical protein n=1 Tax=Rubrivirga sp. TaxID=1885344 RepID=UPI003B52952A